MTRMPRRAAVTLRRDTARRLGELIDEIPAGDLPPQVLAVHRAFVALDAAVRASSRWSRTVRVDLDADALRP